MQFRLGSIPVRVRFPFVVLSLVFASARGNEPKTIAIGVAMIFLAVMVHELGHALVGKAFGLTPQIELHGLGGATSWAVPPEKPLGSGRSILVSLAGPFAGFALYGLAVVLSRTAFDPKHPIAELAMFWIRVACLGWGIANLVPMMPLDGGNVMRSVLDLLTKGKGEKPARVISIGVAGLVLMFAGATRNLWVGFAAALFTFWNMQALRQVDTRLADPALGEAIAKAYPALEREDGAAAIAVIEPALSPHASRDLLASAMRILAYAHLIEGNWEKLMLLLEAQRELIGAEELERYARTARELGRTVEADRIERFVPRARAANDFA
ncbi:MAG: hypothetical protein JST00_14440 [Deltaproteobacteria bacterium]|nr:hypothetical protein [Deltaproteobacteria bacterium]